MKRYNENPDQLGHVDDYEAFLQELNKVWQHAYRVLVPGGRLVCVVGDVCVSRKPTDEQRRLSKIDKKDFNRWFQQIWNIPGASLKKHLAPFPLELASRLVRMFSFTGDTVLDPFSGSGTTMVAALKNGRNSVGVEIDPE